MHEEREERERREMLLLHTPTSFSISLKNSFFVYLVMFCSKPCTHLSSYVCTVNAPKKK